MTWLLGIGLVMTGAVAGLVVVSWAAAAGHADEYERGYRAGYYDGRSGEVEADGASQRESSAPKFQGA
jgi:hypothetical protein